MGCLATTVFLGCIASSGGMLFGKLDGMTASWSYQQAMIPLYVFEGVLLLTYVGVPLRAAAEGLLWKGLRVAFVVLLAMRLDGANVWWMAVLSPLVAWVLTTPSTKIKACAAALHSPEHGLRSVIFDSEC
jgi:hypothetical protein